MKLYLVMIYETVLDGQIMFATCYVGWFLWKINQGLSKYMSNLVLCLCCFGLANYIYVINHCSVIIILWAELIGVIDFYRQHLIV